MKISEEEYKYMYIRDKIKKSMIRWDQKTIADKMGTDSQKVSWIVNWSRITNIDWLKEIALYWRFNESDFEDLEKEASREAYFQRYWIYPWDSTPSELSDMQEEELLEAIYSRSGHTISDQDKAVIMWVINSFKR